MGKKKKQSQKKRQVKALKRRAQQKAARKQRNVLKAKRKMPGMPGMPGGLPPHMQQMAQQLMEFSMPIIEMAAPETPGEMNALAAITQGFWGAFQQQDLEKRAQMLEQTRAAYESMPWAKIAFDELAENLLKRHILLSPKSHTEEERSRYSEEELAAAMDVSFAEPEGEEGEATVPVEAPKPGTSLPTPPPGVPDLPDISKIIGTGRSTTPEIPDLEEIASEVLPKSGGAGEPAEAPSAAEPVSQSILSAEAMDATEALSLLSEADREALEELRAELQTSHNDADFIDENDPIRQKLLNFQSRLADLFEQYLQHKGVEKSVAAAHAAVLHPFFDPFLKEYHQASIFSANADHMEEYLLDYYVRKTARTPQTDRYALNAFRLFFDLAQKLEVVAPDRKISAHLDDLQEEFEEFVAG